MRGVAVVRVGGWARAGAVRACVNRCGVMLRWSAGCNFCGGSGGRAGFALRCVRVDAVVVVGGGWRRRCGGLGGAAVGCEEAPGTFLALGAWC
jgi:hypothetical protein